MMKPIILKHGTINKLGGMAALYGAVVYVVTMIFFLAVLDYPNITEPAEKVAMIVENQTLVITIRWLSYVLFGVALVILSVALYEKMNLKDSQIKSK